MEKGKGGIPQQPVSLLLGARSARLAECNKGFEWVVSRVYTRLEVSLPFRKCDEIDRKRKYWSK